jgi:hypothetical protein
MLAQERMEEKKAFTTKGTEDTEYEEEARTILWGQYPSEFLYR